MGDKALFPVLVMLLGSAGALANDLDGYFDWPLGACVATQLVMGHDVPVVQNFANPTHPEFGPREHSGIDLGAAANQTVYASADGVVECDNTAPGAARAWYPGRVVVIRHEFGGTVGYSQYGHMGELFVAPGDAVRRGQPIGTVLDQDAVNNTHLHFEIRDFARWDANDCPGPGYAPAGETATAHGWRDPVAHYYTHRPPHPATVVTWSSARNLRASPDLDAEIVAELPPSSSVVAEAVVRERFDPEAANWWYQVRYDGEALGYVNGFQKGGYGSSLAIGEAMRVGSNWRNPGRPLISYGFNDPDDFAAGRVRNLTRNVGLDGTIVGTAALAPGARGTPRDRSLGLDGVTAYVVVDDSAQVHFSNGFAVEAAAWRASNEGEDAIAGQWYSGADQWLLTFYPDGNGKLIFTVRLADGSYETVDHLIPDCPYLGTWTRIAARYDPRDDGLRLYWNGRQVAKRVVRGRGLFASERSIEIGHAGPEWSRFLGRIDNLRIWRQRPPRPGGP
jgi:murein DD-endopeptidase MepM/ murein hydrolase activator NlpD